MDQFRDAVDRAKSAAKSANVVPGSVVTAPTQEGVSILKLDGIHLESQRIVSHLEIDYRSRAFDMLRTQILQTMDANGWQFLAVTSPTAGCGKSVTAINLALSIARQPERSVLLVDMDLQKPKISEYMGLGVDRGLLSVLDGRRHLRDVIVEASIGRSQLLVLPGEVCRSGSAEWMGSQAMTSLLQAIKREFRNRIVIFDMPPVLLGDDVLAVLPQIESVLMIAAAGQSTNADIKECSKYIPAAKVVRVVLSKATEKTGTYTEYY